MRHEGSTKWGLKEVPVVNASAALLPWMSTTSLRLLQIGCPKRTHYQQKAREQLLRRMLQESPRVQRTPQHIDDVCQGLRFQTTKSAQSLLFGSLVATVSEESRTCFSTWASHYSPVRACISAHITGQSCMIRKVASSMLSGISVVSHQVFGLS